jgi:hypothetical protein
MKCNKFNIQDNLLSSLNIIKVIKENEIVGAWVMHEGDEKGIENFS